MRCPIGATVTRTSQVPKKGDEKPPERTYSIANESIQVAERKDPKGRRVRENVKVARCKETLKKVSRLNADFLHGECPKHGEFQMNAAIWADEAKL